MKRTPIHQEESRHESGGVEELTTDLDGSRLQSFPQRAFQTECIVHDFAFGVDHHRSAPGGVICGPLRLPFRSGLTCLAKVLHIWLMFSAVFMLSGPVSI